MKKRIAIRLSVLGLLGLTFLPLLYGFSINGAAPGAVASMTPVAVGTSTVVPIATCTTVGTVASIEFNNIGSSNCYIAPAQASSPCAAASPIPNAGTKAGEWLPPNSKWTFSFSGAGSQWGGLPQLAAEWDAVCDGAAAIGVTKLP